MSRKRHSSGDYKVYIGNLPRDASEREIEKAFRDFGPIKSVWVAQNPPGFAFVEYEDERDAADAIKDMDEATVCGARIRVRNGNDYVRPSRGPPRGAMGRRPFDPSDRCYRCNQKGHYAYDCDKYQAGSRNRRRSRSRDRRDSSRGRRRSYSRSYSRSRSRDNKRRSRTPSKSRNKISRHFKQHHQTEKTIHRDRRKSRSRSRSRS